MNSRLTNLSVGMYQGKLLSCCHDSVTLERILKMTFCHNRGKLSIKVINWNIYFFSAEEKPKKKEQILSFSKNCSTDGN